MLEGERDRAICRPALQLDFFRRRRRIVDGDVQAGVPGGVIGRQPLHARPAAGVSARVPKRPLPQAALHFARAAREDDVRLPAQIGDGDLRKRDLPQLPVGGRLDAQRPANRTGGRVQRRHGFDPQALQAVPPMPRPGELHAAVVQPLDPRLAPAVIGRHLRVVLGAAAAQRQREQRQRLRLPTAGRRRRHPATAADECRQSVRSSSRPRSPADSMCNCSGSLPSTASERLLEAALTLQPFRDSQLQASLTLRVAGQFFQIGACLLQSRLHPPHGHRHIRQRRQPLRRLLDALQRVVAAADPEPRRQTPLGAAPRRPRRRPVRVQVGPVAAFAVVDQDPIAVQHRHGVAAVVHGRPIAERWNCFPPPGIRRSGSDCRPPIAAVRRPIDAAPGSGLPAR